MKLSPLNTSLWLTRVKERAMQLLDRYLEAMRFWLPESEQEDILKELSENILAQAEDKEEELGRPLTIEEESALLKRHGHPMLFGVRYGRRLQYLIGPVMYPFYKLVIKISLAILAIGHIINAVVLAVSKHPPGEVITSLFGFFHAALPMLGWMTIVFAVIDHFAEKYKVLDKWVANWDPAALPNVQLKKTKVESMWKRLLGVITESTLAIWWLIGLRYPYLLLGPAAAIITWGPIWLKLYPAFVVLALAGIAFKFLTLFKPRSLPIQWTQMVFKASRLVVMFLLLKAGNLMVAANPVDPHPAAAAAVQGLQTGLNIGLAIAVIIGTLQLGWECFMLFKKGSTCAANGVTTTCA
jgi:hypothetical protein